MTDFKIREARVSDAEKIARVHVNSWIETYTGIIPDEYIAGRTIERRKSMWESVLEDKKQHESIFVSEVEGHVIGFINGGDARELKYGLQGEIYALYLLKKYHGLGIGKTLFNTQLSVFKQDKMLSMYLWVLRDNRTVGFYQRMGGKKRAEREDEMGGRLLIEDLYQWEHF